MDQSGPKRVSLCTSKKFLVEWVAHAALGPNSDEHDPSEVVLSFTLDSRNPAQSINQSLLSVD